MICSDDVALAFVPVVTDKGKGRVRRICGRFGATNCYGMKKWLFYVFLLICLAEIDQVNGQTIYLARVGWKITVPEGYRLKDTMENSPAMDSAEGSKTQDLVYYPHNILFTIEKDSYFKLGALNSISALWLPYDSSHAGSWAGLLQWNDSLLLTSINEAGIKTDTTIGAIILAGIRFRKMEMTSSISGNTLFRMIDLSAPFGDHALRISISYNDEQEKGRLLDMIRKSTFRKKG